MKKVAVIFMALLASVAVSAEPYEDVVAAMVNALSKPLHQWGGSAIAVLDFSDLQGRTTEFGRFISEEMSTAIVMQSDGINVIDRANLDRILAENKLQRSGLVDPENIKRLGKITGASALVIGSYTQLGDIVRLTAKVITTDTAQIVAASKGKMALNDDIRGLLKAGIFDEGVTTLAARGASSIPPSLASERLVQKGPGYTASLVSAVYFPVEHRIQVQAEYRNEDNKSHCLGFSAARPSSVITSSGDLLAFEKAPGLKLVQETKEIANSGTAWTSESNSAAGWTSMQDFNVVPPGATQRLVLIFQADNLRSDTMLDVSINLLRGHVEPDQVDANGNTTYHYTSYHYRPGNVPPGCNVQRNQVPATTLVFNGVAPTI